MNWKLLLGLVCQGSLSRLVLAEQRRPREKRDGRRLSVTKQKGLRISSLCLTLNVSVNSIHMFSAPRMCFCFR